MLALGPLPPALRNYLDDRHEVRRHLGAGRQAIERAGAIVKGRLEQKPVVVVSAMAKSDGPTAGDGTRRRNRRLAKPH